ncbi:MAG: BamA/TamA family outer membrane protein, partial [Chitinivibrionales bacterium]
GISSNIKGKLNFVGWEPGYKIGTELNIPWHRFIESDINFASSYRLQNETSFSGRFFDFTTALNISLTRYTDVFLRWRYENVNIDTIKTDEDELQYSDKNTSGIGFGITNDTRNNIMNTKKGHLIFFTGEIAGLTGMQVNKFSKFRMELRGFIPVFGSDIVFASSLRAGILIPGNTKDPVAIQERFFLGGASVMRGYSQNEFRKPEESRSDKPTGGNLYAAMNLAEFRLPVFSFLSTVAFIDAGSLWNLRDPTASAHLKSLNLSDIRYNYGFGLRIKTPLGVIRGDVGFKMFKKDNENLAAFHIGIGQAF